MAGISLLYRTVAPIGLFIAGIVCIVASVLTGEAEVSLFLVVPVFSGSGGLFILGIALIVFSFVAGFMFLMMGQMEIAGASFEPAGDEMERRFGKSDRKYGGVVLIGPVPIAFGSDKKTALAMLVIGIVLGVAALVVLALLFG